MISGSLIGLTVARLEEDLHAKGINCPEDFALSSRVVLTRISNRPVVDEEAKL